MVRNKAWTKIIAVMVFCTVLFGCVLSVPPVRVAADSYNEMIEEQKRLEQEKKQIDKEVNRLKNDVANQKEYQAQLAKQIKNTQNQIANLSGRINALNETIDQKNTEIADTQAKIDQNYELFKKRLKAMYMSNDATVLSVLFGSSTFAEFLSAAETTKRIADYDDKLIKELTAQKEKVEKDKAEIEESRKQVEADKAAVLTKNDELNQQMSASSQKLDEMNEITEEAKAKQRQINAELEATNKEIEAWIRANQGGGSLSPGGWLWPVRGYTRISDGYGNRILNGVQQFHKGIDIPAARGTPILASKSGTVIDSRFSSSYGELVIVDHGGGYSTVYAHNTSRLVSNGQKVTQGQTIALAGDTGQAYGSHCHFEVRINGVVDNPLKYVVAK